MNVRAKLTQMIVLAGVVSVLTGCGYSTERPFRQDVRTVHVPIFQSREFRRGLEFQLTEALQKRIQLDTPYRLASKRKADTELIGEVIEVRQTTFGSDFVTGLPRETGATIIVAFRWKDLRTGEILVERPRFTQTAEYIRPIGEDFFLGSERFIDRLAEAIVEQMEEPW